MKTRLLSTDETRLFVGIGRDCQDLNHPEVMAVTIHRWPGPELIGEWSGTPQEFAELLNSSTAALLLGTYKEG